MKCRDMYNELRTGEFRNANIFKWNCLIRQLIALFVFFINHVGYYVCYCCTYKYNDDLNIVKVRKSIYRSSFS
jgi:hypothetical protein